MATPLTPNALAVLERRYLLKDEAGQALESPEGMFRRVARHIAEVDRQYEGGAEAERFEARYFEALSGLEFLPNSPTLMNAGTELGQLAACFVLPVGDSIREIFEAVRDMALVHQSGGGTGFSFSGLRPLGDSVRETGGVASGPTSFMRVFDVGTDVVKQGGRRRGANMGVLSVDHPDILTFAAAKQQPTDFTNFNLSVAVPDAFLEAVRENASWPLINPRTGRCVERIPARKVWEAICQEAWRTGDPGVLFIDEINRHNPTPALGRMEATNPCGEQPLLPYESCTLGSINLARLVRDGAFDWRRLAALTRLGVRFLDNVIDASHSPLPEIERATRATRKIGLGVMGLAEALIQLGVPYASRQAGEIAARVLGRISEVGRAESAALAARRGAFPEFARSVWPGRGFDALRNATITTVAPTGTLSIIAGTSSGIEPLFAVAYTRTAFGESELREVSPLLVAALERSHQPVESIVQEAEATGSIQHLEQLPADLRELFRTALEIPAEQHVRVQAAVQRHTDNAVSKTVNLPAAATEADVQAVYELAWRLRCKGVTIYRYGARGEQVLHLGRVPAYAAGPERVVAHPEFAGECRLCSV